MALNLIHLPQPYPMKHDIHGNQTQVGTPRYVHIHRQFSCSSATTQVSIPTTERRSANYQPNIWSYDFVQSIENVNADEKYQDEASRLQEEVSCMINDENQDLSAILQLIDDIKRLGLASLFEKDIQRALETFLSLRGFKEKNSLHDTALAFRLLRQHGYEVSQDVFKDFIDQKGNLTSFVEKDVIGILSLYEASYFAREGEDLLDLAMAQARTHLKNLQKSTNACISERVIHALELPFCRRMAMLEARWYIEVYDKMKDANPALLKLAKLEFNMVQSVLQRDLQDMSRWWRGLGLSNKLRFSRDRLVECFFWTIGMVFETEFSSCRRGLTKVTSLITTIDDVYDVYGTLDELEQFTDAVERWDINAVENLPDYMKLCFLSLYNTINEMGYDTLKEHGVNVIPYLTKAWADLCKAFLQEAKWSYEKCTPTFQDYLENAWRSVSGTVILIHAYFLMGHHISKQALDCLENYHQVLRWPSIIFRLCNDLGTSSAELARGESANSISCFMYETGLSEKHAREHMHELIDKAWKKMNEYGMNQTPFTESFIEIASNLARISHCTYQHGDSHGAPDTRSKERVLSLIINPIPIGKA